MNLSPSDAAAEGMFDHAAQQGMSAPDGWEDISSAPRDGRWVLLAGGDTCEGDYVYDLAGAEKRPVIGRWSDERSLQYEMVDENDPASEWHDVEYWDFGFWDGDWRSSYRAPKWWAPYPPLPRHLDKGEG